MKRHHRWALSWTGIALLFAWQLVWEADVWWWRLMELGWFTIAVLMTVVHVARYSVMRAESKPDRVGPRF